MGNPTGFLEIEKKEKGYEDPINRIKHFKALLVPLDNEEISKQGARCMDCGISYCHQGCPVNNLIPDWNDLVYKHEWKALDTLHLQIISQNLLEGYVLLHVKQLAL